MSVGINPPKTPITKGSNGVSVAALPNMCKMPGPPAPFVPAPLPNVGNSNGDEKGYSTTVLVEGKAVAIKGASYGSKGDMPSKGTGGGLVSATVHGATKIVGPGSMNVKIEGKNVQLLGDFTTNNNGGAPNTANPASGTLQAPEVPKSTEDVLQEVCCECDAEVEPDTGPDNCDSCATLGEKKHQCCEEKIASKEGIGGEKGYNRKDGSPFTGGPRARKPGEHYWGHKRRISGTAWPDASALNSSGKPEKFYDFKFGCEKDVPIWVARDGRKGPPAKGTSRPVIGPKQKAKYKALAEKLGFPEKNWTPQTVSNKKC